ncbi:hypothetical protein GRI40_10610 [Altererythrobacter aerius]|uniref:Secreted protein n=1 Tax=Tsuneonella aeria TaxID=1837929 RepID=A0A6I4TGM3_9SPHN|nr:hypothetical protein [Tsuneonella aeria]MXO75668.1 hypothetical protein [Tsuneonella aeria]
MEIDQTALIAILALILVAALILWVLVRSRRTAALRDRFGETEYDRTVAAAGGRGKAEANLMEREKRAASLELRPLGPAERERFAGAWAAAKARFVDDPAAAVMDGDRAIGDVMLARGFPVDDFDARFESLTVEHGEVARHYRAGHDIALKQVDGKATTEDLRQAMIHYEELFDELTNEQPDRPEGAVTRPAQIDRSHV